jgi:transketolase
MQRAYLMALYDIASKDKNVISIIADSGTGYDELFKRDFPKQFFDFGISEQNMVAAAAGMASCEKIPFVYTAGAFLAYRSIEFIRDDCCFQNMNVKIVGMGSGLSWSTLGATHHTTEDIAVLRSFPGLTIFSPGCPSEVADVVNAAYDIKGPVYIRLGMSNEPELYTGEHNFKAGKASILSSGKDITFFSTGSIVSEVASAAKALKDKYNIEAGVTNIHTVKPFDDESVINAAKNSKMIISVEEHNVLGGLGSVVADVLAENASAVPLRKIGLNDCFAHGYGTVDDVRKTNNLDCDSICEQAYKFFTHL